MIWLVLFLILLMLFYSWWLKHTWNDGAPYEGTPPDIVERVMKLGNVGKDDIFYELGSGDGRVVISAAMHGAQSYGIEIDKLRALYSKIWIRILRLNKKAKIITGDVFKQDLSKATIIYTYLLSETHEKLREKFKKELKKGTKIIAGGFEIKDWKPIKVDLKGPRYGPLYLCKV